MNKSVLFKVAHNLTKKTIKAGDNYKATFSMALQIVLKMNKKYTMASVSNVEKLAKLLESKGVANYWYNGTQKGFNRYYVGLDVDTCFIDIKMGVIAVDGDIDFLKKMIGKIQKITG